MIDYGLIYFERYQKMESQRAANPSAKIRSELTSKWSKLTTQEVKEIFENHNKLPEALKRRYSMSEDDAQKESALFFKPYDKKKFSAQKTKD